MGRKRRLRQCHCTRRIPNGAERRFARRHRARQGISHAHADGTFWKTRRTRRRSRLPRVRRCKLRHRPCACRRRRLSRKRRESLNIPDEFSILEEDSEMTIRLALHISPRPWIRLARDILRAVAAICVLFCCCDQFAAAETQKPLVVYFADVEGGQATLFVTPAGESLLIDTGWDGFNGRDADRIVAAAKEAGLSRIDSVLITHYHSDHVGGVTQLAARIPIGTFIDHGDNSDAKDEPTLIGWRAYQRLIAEGKYKCISVKPGDALPFRAAQFAIVNGGGKVLEEPLPGAGVANQNCTATPLPPADHTENEFSLGFVMTFGKFRLVDLGDLPWAKELELVCPANKLGKADIYVATHHGLFFSGSPALVHDIAPRVAIVENG